MPNESCEVARDIRRERMADSNEPGPDLPAARTSFKPSHGPAASAIQKAAIDGSFDGTTWNFIDRVHKAEREAGRRLRYSELAEVLHGLGWKPPAEAR